MKKNLMIVALLAVAIVACGYSVFLLLQQSKSEQQASEDKTIVEPEPIAP